MNLVGKQQLITAVRDRYQRASKKQKEVILDEFVASTGYHRKYALTVLGKKAGKPKPHAQRRRASFGNYKLELTQSITGVSGGLAREVTSAPAAYHLAVATFNVEHLAATDPITKFNTLAGLIVNNLRAPDIIAIEEIQGNTGAIDDGVVDATTTWTMLISAIQTAGGPAYEFRQINPP